MNDDSPAGQPLGFGLLITSATALFLVLALLLVAPFVPAVFAVQRAVDHADQEVLDFPPVPDEIAPPTQISLMYDAAGDLIGELSGPVRRDTIDLDQVPEHVRQAVIATEDAQFYEHNGVHHRAIIRATVRNVRAGDVVEGASTITQQYVRNVLLSPEQTLERKLQEIRWAVELEQRLDKDEILERYLNTVYFGNGVYGIATAASFYFNKQVSELEVWEAAMLAGLIRAPQVNDPLDNPEGAAARRDIVIRQMAAEGFISREDADYATDKPLGLDVREEPPPREPFFFDWVRRITFDPAITVQPEVQEILGETPEERRTAIYEDGLRIVTTLQPDLQDAAQDAVSRWVNVPLDDPMAGVVTLHPESGAVLTMAVGPKPFGPCPEDEQPCEVTQVNPLVPGGGGEFGRQPGSSFKPIVAATAIDRGLGTDTTYDTPSGEPIEGCGSVNEDDYDPENFSQQDQGELDMTEATRRSTNVYFAKLARDAGVLNIVEMAERLGLKHSPNLNEEHFGSRSCSIGLGTVNVFPLEMANVYGTFENDGVRCEPYAIARILDRDGDVVYEHEPRCEQVLDPGVASQVRDLLTGPPSSGGTAPYVGSVVPGPVYGKTGTTDEFVDAWFMGFVPGMATAAWVGYEEPTEMRGVQVGGRYWGRITGGSIPARIWGDYMAQAVQLTRED